jgi:collagenase-like PrtC family protease
MRICAATCWEDEHLRRLAALRTPDAAVHEVFGSLRRTASGSGRDAALLPDVDDATVRRHIEQAHALGIRFNYLMNGSCMGGHELTRAGRAELAAQIRWVESTGADSVTVAIPFLVELVGDLAPRLEVVVSTIAHVDSVPAARAFRDLGARRITVSLMANRDLALLRALREQVDCELEVLANEMCLYRCAFRTYHYGLMAHGSQPGPEADPVEYPHLHCSARRVLDPAELLKARFIRPEDVATYEALGIDLFKLAGRGRSSADLLRAAAAYVGRRHEGNLLDIMELGLWSDDATAPPRLFIDNRALDGFLEAVAAVDCGRACGAACTYCDALARQALVTGAEAVVATTAYGRGGERR